MTDLSKNIQALREKKAVVEMGGGEAAIEKQIAMGKLTARDRILSLLDKNSFHEYDLFVKHDGRDFGMDRKIYQVMVLLQVQVRSSVLRFVSMHKTLRLPVVHWACSMHVRSRRSWIML